jgi:transposase InsO family protein
VIDDFSRECLAAVVDNSLSGERVARELDAIAERRGYPCMVVSDNGTELTSNAMLAWQQAADVAHERLIGSCCHMSRNPESSRSGRSKNG